ncbi:MAG: hypothetical protein GY953_06010 [bacterium]|nr:hypothetical protein [bacterium]
MNRENILKALGIAALLTLMLWLPSQGVPLTVAAATQSAADTLVGCLTPGQNPGEFYVAVQGSERKTKLLSTANLAEYAGKHVKLTGSWETVGDQKAFRVTRVEVIADSCPSAP